MKKTFKEFLTPAGVYSEGPMSLMTHFGVLYKLDRIFELSVDLPVTNISLAALEWMTVGAPPDKDRVEKSDVKVPIIVTPHNGAYVIIDGMHRVQKALKQGAKTIPARIIFHDILAAAKLGANHPQIGNQGDLNQYFEGKSARHTDQSFWEEEYPEEIGSAFEMWMNQDRKDEMWKAYQKGADFKSIYVDFPKNGMNPKDKFWTAVEKKMKPLKDKGWKEFESEENSDGTEFLMIKKSK